jgi:hypothetical protein
MEKALRARAPLSLVLAGDEVSALGPLVDACPLALVLDSHATVELRGREPGEWRSLVRGFGRRLLVEPDLDPPADEGILGVEAHLLRRFRRASANELVGDVLVDAPDMADLGSLEARAEALAACLERQRGACPPGLARRAAARAGSPLGSTLGDVSPVRLPPTLAGALEPVLVLVRDRHAPPGPSARLALLAWHSGEPEKRAAIERAAKASRAASELASKAPSGIDRFVELVGEEGRALEALAPRAERERLVDDALSGAGARVVRRLGERGLVLVIARDADARTRLLEKARELHLEMVSSRGSSSLLSPVVEEVAP